VARINIEDDIWTDPRFMKLTLAVGDHLKATGLIVMAWRAAQKFWLNGKRPIPREVFERDLDEALISVDLAERNEAGDVYIKGSEEQFAWLIQRQKAGKDGGKKSGKARLEKKEKSPKRTEAGSSETKRAEPSSSFSISSSISKESPLPSVKGERPAEPSGPDVARIIGVYVKAWQTRYKTRERPDVGGRTQGLIKALLRDYPPERLCSLIEHYCAMGEPWFEKKTHDFPTFRENLTKIAASMGGVGSGGVGQSDLMELGRRIGAVT
jgi:hypothetical protein